jgi:CheY-like chemotaxis protein
LLLARQLIELHGGTIRLERSDDAVESLDIGFGALRVANGVADIDRAVSWHPDQFNGTRVLVVDDQAEMREVLATLLGQRQAEVSTAASASEAMQLFSHAQPTRYAIAVLDIAMPDEDGLSLVTRMRNWEAANQWPRLPTIALTAHASAELQQRAGAAGFDRFLSKPVNPELLFRTIAELVARVPARATSRAATS